MIRKNDLLKGLHLVSLLLNFALIYFWMKYAFYLKEAGALYYGAGDSYWQVTFKSLIETLFIQSRPLNYLLVFMLLLQGGWWIYGVARERIKYLLESKFALCFSALVILILGFYFLKLVMGVNYPEDRTGLFFYVFFVISLAFCLDELPAVMGSVFLAVPVVLLIHFAVSVNFEVHPWRVYETMPHRYMTRLKKEQQQAGRLITVAGHRVRELFYGFMNYNSSEKLNHITSPEALQMNCDYALAYSQDEPYYRSTYTEIDAEKYWGFRLLKRKVPLERELIMESTQPKIIDDEGEYHNAEEVSDTTFGSNHPLQADFTLSFGQVPVPFNAWLVLQVDTDEPGAQNIFVRVPLNLIKYDWNGTREFKTSVITGNIPLKIKRFVAYIWNIDKVKMNVTIEKFSLYRLNGEAVTLESKAKI
jgi:hypothetical protein